jgi:PAS domain S-box-containing protein
MPTNPAITNQPESAPSRNEERFRNLIANMQDFVIATTADGTVTLVNPITVKMLGY